MAIEYTLRTRYRNLKHYKSSERLAKIVNNTYGKMSKTQIEWFQTLSALMEVYDKMSGREAMLRLLSRMASRLYGEDQFVVSDDFDYMSAKSDRPTDHEIYKLLPNHATITRWMNLITSATSTDNRDTVMKLEYNNIHFHIQDNNKNVESVVTIQRDDWQAINRLIEVNDINNSRNNN